MGISTHILDTAVGRPAAGVTIALFYVTDAEVREIGRGQTDHDGRLRTLTPPELELQVGVYRLEFATGSYYQARKEKTFFPSVTITFEVTDHAQHYHVPLLLSPFGYSTYRGS